MDGVQSKSCSCLGQLPSELINFMAMALAFFVRILSIEYRLGKHVAKCLFSAATAACIPCIHIQGHDDVIVVT